MISVENLEKTFHTSHGDLPVLMGINQTIEGRKKVITIGPPGSGRNTFLRCLNLLEQPTSDEIWFEEEEVTSPKCNVNLLRQKIGMVFQHFSLLPHLTILENVTLAPTSLKLKTQEEAGHSAMQLLGRVSLADKAQTYPAQLSGGQKQRTAIVHSLVTEPKVMLLDGPISALDPEVVGEVLQVMKQLAQESTTMIVVTHEMGFAREVATRILFMDQEQILKEAPPQRFLASPKHARLQDFLSKIL